MSQHTPGPWAWELNRKSRHLALVSNGLPGSMHEIVMDFVRWGMGGAAPRFRKAVESPPSLVLMHRAEEFGQVVPKRSHHADWYQILDHPDARLIAAAPDLLAACLAMLGTWGGQDEEVIIKARDMARDAIAKAIDAP